MRRMIWLLAVIALIVGVVSPVGALPSERTESFIVLECPDPGNPQDPGKVWFPTEDRIHIRGMVVLVHEYLYIEGVGWATEPFGQNVIVVNLNGESNMSGTFDFSDDGTIGDFEGTWVINDGVGGQARGRSDDGRLLHVTLGLDSPASPYPWCGVVEMVVLDPAS